MSIESPLIHQGELAVRWPRTWPAIGGETAGMTTPGYGVSRQKPDRPPVDLSDIVMLVRTQDGRVPAYRSFTAAEVENGDAQRYADADAGQHARSAPPRQQLAPDQRRGAETKCRLGRPVSPLTITAHRRQTDGRGQVHKPVARPHEGPTAPAHPDLLH